MPTAEVAHLIFASTNLLFQSSAYDVHKAQEFLEARKLPASSQMSGLNQLALNIMPAPIGNGVAGFLDGVRDLRPSLFSSKKPNIRSFVWLGPMSTQYVDADQLVEDVHQLLNQCPNTHPLNTACAHVYSQLCMGLARRQSIEEIFKSLTALRKANNKLSQLDERVSWILETCIQILSRYSHTPALEFINQSFPDIEADITISDLDHPLWGIAYLTNVSTQATPLRHIQAHTPQFSPSAAHMLGLFMGLISPAFFPPSWLISLTRRRLKAEFLIRESNKDSAVQLPLFVLSEE